MTNNRRSWSQSYVPREGSTRQVGQHPDNMAETLPEDDLRRQLDRSRGLMNDLTSHHGGHDTRPTQPVGQDLDQQVGYTNIHLHMPMTYTILPPTSQMFPPTPGTFGGNPMQGTPQQGFTQIYQPWSGTPGYYFVASTLQIPIAEQQQLATQHVRQWPPQPQNRILEEIKVADRPGSSGGPVGYLEEVKVVDRSRRPNQEGCGGHRQTDVTQRESVFERIRKGVKSRLGPRDSQSHPRSKSRRTTERRKITP